jgi:hypothetical protein
VQWPSVTSRRRTRTEESETARGDHLALVVGGSDVSKRAATRPPTALLLQHECHPQMEPAFSPHAATDEGLCGLSGRRRVVRFSPDELERGLIANDASPVLARPCLVWPEGYRNYGRSLSGVLACVFSKCEPRLTAGHVVPALEYARGRVGRRESTRHLRSAGWLTRSQPGDAGRLLLAVALSARLSSIPLSARSCLMRFGSGPLTASGQICEGAQGE